MLIGAILMHGMKDLDSLVLFSLTSVLHCCSAIDFSEFGIRPLSLHNNVKDVSEGSNGRVQAIFG